MSARERRPGRRKRELTERDYMPRWVKRILITILVIFILYLIFATLPLWLPIFY